MSLEENKKLIQRLYDEGINRHDAAAAAAFYAPDAKNHGRQVGRAGMQTVFEAHVSRFQLSNRAQHRGGRPRRVQNHDDGHAFRPAHDGAGLHRHADRRCADSQSGSRVAVPQLPRERRADIGARGGAR